jgi:hypothetical protein
MRFPGSLSVPAALLVWAGATGAADLSTVDRTLTKEPAYQSRPKYCLLVFGKEARHRVWLVLDGDTLYVDRNGDGDLTEPGKRVTAPALRPGDNPFCTRERSVDAGAVSVGGLTHTDLVVSQMESRRTMPGWQDYLDSVWRQVPDGVVYEVSVKLDPRCYDLFGDAAGRRVKHLAFTDRNGRLAFAGRPQDAPVIHFGGPLALQARPGEKLRRGQDPGEVNFWLGTPGRGPGTFAVMWHDLVPAGAEPVVEVRFPAAGPGRPAVLRKYSLRQRC